MTIENHEWWDKAYRWDKETPVTDPADHDREPEEGRVYEDESTDTSENDKTDETPEEPEAA